MKTKSSKVDFDPGDILPAEALFWEKQGYTGESHIPEKISDFYRESLDIFEQRCEAKALLKSCSTEEALLLFHGLDRNEPDNPIEPIIASAGNLGIFTATIGDEISIRIDRLFEKNEFLIAFMLDSLASMAVDRLVVHCEHYFQENLSNENQNPENRVLSYSPGYCGWHVSSQKMLFEFLKPRQIGITVNNSFMMTPLKSTSGIIAKGSKEIHLFKPEYDFCRYCSTKSCVIRMRELKLN